MNNELFLNNEVYRKKSSMKFTFYFLTIFIVFFIGGFYYFFDRLFPYSQIIGQILVLTVATNLLGQFYLKKEKYQRIYKDEAYVKAFYRFHVTAMPLIYVSALHPIFAYSTGEIINCWYINFVFGGYLILSAILLHRRTIKIFGVDNLFMYYVYYPEKGGKTDSIIHSMLRHPIYSAMMRLALGLGLLRGTLESFCVGLIIPFLQFFWLYVYEEPDLITRFGKEYKKYRHNVWALLVKPKELLLFWGFLFGKK